MENGIKLKSYQINFFKLKKKVYEENKRLYDISINVIRFNELQKRAGKMKKAWETIYKRNKNHF